MIKNSFKWKGMVLALIILCSALIVMPVSADTPGTIVSWGDDGSSMGSDTPTDSDFVAIAGGYYHSLALKSDGSIVSWGWDYNNMVSNTPTDSDFDAIAAGAYHSLALRSNGSIVSWGRNYYNVVSDTPTDSDFVAIAGGGSHSLALRSNGSIISWGLDNYDQVSNTPTDSDFVAIAGGDYHSLALKSDGSIVSWGGQVSDTPTDSDFVAIASGDLHSLALRSNGSIVSWGWDYNNVVSDTPTDSDFVAIAGGGSHSLALRSNGSIVSWGYDGYGQVTDTPTDSDFVAIASGSYHSLALKSVPTVQEPPVAALTATPTHGLAPLTVTFNASSSSDPDGTIASYEWDFGDEDTGTGVTPSHEYDEPGTYEAILTVTDDGGTTDTTKVTIIAFTPAEATSDLATTVYELSLPPDIETGLTDKLEVTESKLENEKYNVAQNTLTAFINQVNSQRDKTLTEEQADELIAIAQQIIESIPLK
jgi:PKD repeat protein